MVPWSSKQTHGDAADPVGHRRLFTECPQGLCSLRMMLTCRLTASRLSEEAGPQACASPTGIRAHPALRTLDSQAVQSCCLAECRAGPAALGALSPHLGQVSWRLHPGSAGSQLSAPLGLRPRPWDGWVERKREQNRMNSCALLFKRHFPARAGKCVPATAEQIPDKGRDVRSDATSRGGCFRGRRKPRARGPAS